MRSCHERMRRDGLRPLQLWVADTTAPGFADKIRSQCLAIRESHEEAEILEFVEQVADWPEY